MIQIRTFKKKEKEGSEGKPQFGGQWKVPMLSGPWKVPSLVAFGRRRKNTLVMEILNHKSCVIVLKLNPFNFGYYIYPNSGTLVILLQFNPTFGDEIEIAFKSSYETKNISIFAWSSIFGVGHYCWSCGSIC